MHLDKLINVKPKQTLLTFLPLKMHPREGKHLLHEEPEFNSVQKVHLSEFGLVH